MKRKVNKVSNVKPKVRKNPEPIERPFFYTEDGRQVFYRSINLLDLSEAEEGIRQEFIENGEPLDPPKYMVTAAGGAQIEHDLTENNLQVEGDQEETERRMREWAEHVEANNRLNIELGSITTEIILDALEIDITEDELDAWIAKKRKYHIRLPDDREELIRRYKMGELLRTPKDLLTAQGEIITFSSSGAVTREAVRAAEDMFLGELQAQAERSSEEMGETE